MKFFHASAHDRKRNNSNNRQKDDTIEKPKKMNDNSKSYKITT